jgi:macrolide transport system ATP-binding/permease protein
MNFVFCENFVLHGPKGPLFEPLSFSLNGGNILGLVGPNGIGKSLLLKCLATGVAPHPFRWTGSLKTLGKSSGNGVFFLPQLQTPEIHMPFQLGEIASFERKLSVTMQWFDKKTFSKPWNKASGGEKMQALLARAFASEAQLLVLDEPFNHLDLRSMAFVREAMRAYVETSLNRSIVFVSHLEHTPRAELHAGYRDFPTLEVVAPSFSNGDFQ